MTKLTFLVTFLVGCIFSVSYSRILPPATFSLGDEIPGLQEQGLVNHVKSIGQENEVREKRSLEDLKGILGGVGGILNVTSSLFNAFNTTREIFTRLRNITQRICIDCKPSIKTPTPTEYDNYDDYYDYDRKKRDVDFQERPGNEDLDRQKSNEESSEKVHRVEFSDNLDTLGRLYNALITTYAKLGEARFSVAQVQEETLNFIKTVFIILRDFIQGKEILFVPKDKPYPYELPDIYEYADYESAETFDKRIDELGSAKPKQTDKGLDSMKHTSDTGTIIDIDVVDIIQNPERQKRDTISSFNPAEYFFNFLENLGRKRRSVKLFSNIDRLALSKLRTKRFILNLSESYVNNAIDFLKQMALNTLEKFLDLARNYLDNVNLGGLTGFLKFKRSLPSSGEPVEIVKLIRVISDILPSIRIDDVYSIIEAATRWFNKVGDLANSAVNAVFSKRRRRGVNTFGELFSEFPRLRQQLSDVALYIKGKISDFEGTIKSSLDVAHGFLDTTAAEWRKKRDAGDEPSEDILPTSEQIVDFFKQLEDRVADNFKAIEATVEQLHHW